MLLDSTYIKKFNAKLLKVDIGTQELSNLSEWINKSLTPIFFKNKKSFKKIELELLFKGKSNDLALKNISDFMSNILSEVTLVLDSYSNKYRVILSDNSTEKTESRYMFIKKLTFIGYEFSDEVTETINRTTSKTINVVGNSETPAIVEITPSIDLINLTLKGLEEDPIILKNIKANKKLIVNGEDSTVTVDGVNKFGDTDMWGFPRLKPGANTITVSKNNVDITIKYKPRYI